MSTSQQVSREEVVKFVMCWFDEPRSMATKCVRKMRWGYRIFDPLVVSSYPLLIMGSTLITVHPESGVFIPLSSSPPDMIGPLSYETLNSVEDLNAMIEGRGIPKTQTIHNAITECEREHAERGKTQPFI